MTAVATIGVRLTVPGLHFWPDAPVHRAYLADRHRHLFGIRVEVAVTHDDREIEYHDLQDVVQAHVKQIGIRDGGARDFGPRSCEAIARALGEMLQLRYPGRRLTITVDEDGECWSTVTVE